MSKLRGASFDDTLVRNAVIEFYKNNEQRFIDNKNKIVDIDNSKRDEIYFKSLIHKNE